MADSTLLSSEELDSKESVALNETSETELNTESSVTPEEVTKVESDPKLPTSSDGLFKEESDSRYGAWLKNPANKFFLYSEGYRSSGENLYNTIIEDSFYQNTLIYPLIFSYRQFLELRLKELIMMGKEYIDEPKDFPDEHSLIKLWNIYRQDLLPQIETSIDKTTLNNVERIISQFNTEDSKSMSFRYPVTKAPDRRDSLDRDTIDIVNFKTVIDKVIYFLDCQWDMIAHYKDMKDEMISDMYREYY